MQLAAWEPFHLNKANRALHAGAAVLLWVALADLAGPFGALALLIGVALFGFSRGKSVGLAMSGFALVCGALAAPLWELPMSARFYWFLALVAVRFLLVGVGHKVLEKKFHPLTPELLFLEQVNLAAYWTKAPRGL